MKTVSIISQKGGSGKTMLVLHLAVASALSGRNAAVIDLDPQASAAKWSDRRTVELPVVLSAHASRLPKEMKRVQGAGCETLFLDTAPHSDSAALDVEVCPASRPPGNSPCCLKRCSSMDSLNLPWLTQLALVYRAVVSLCFIPNHHTALQGLQEVKVAS